MSNMELYIKNVKAASSNFIGVLDKQQWERFDSKLWDLKNAIKLLEEDYKKVTGNYPRPDADGGL